MSVKMEDKLEKKEKFFCHAKWIEIEKESNSIKEEFSFPNIFSYHQDYKEIENIKLDRPILFKKNIDLTGMKIKKAEIYGTAHGVYEISINGKKVGDDYLAPGFSSYFDILYYQTYDITPYLKSSMNELNILVADGWYKGKIGLCGMGNQFGDKLALISQIEIELESGEKIYIGTDKSFTASSTYIEYSDLFIGEKHDKHNLDIEEYKVKEVDLDLERLKLDIAEPIKCIEKIYNPKLLVSPKGEKILDFGRNISGIVEVKIKGNPGDRIVLQHSEELDKDGNFFFNIIGQNKYQVTSYVLEGNKEETFLPKFTYQGFRYVKIIESPKDILTENFTAYILSTACKKVGKIKSSNEYLNKFFENVMHSQESNFISIPTDCPQREKAGWTGDAQIYTPTAMFNMKIDNFMKRWLENMRSEQYRNGQIPALIPFIESDEQLTSNFGNISPAGWSDASIIIPWHLYHEYEDLSFLEDNYNMMKKWINYVENRCKSNVNETMEEYENYIWDMDFHYGDWMIPSLKKEDGTIEPMLSAKFTANQVATMYFSYSSKLLSKISKILNKVEEEKKYLKLSEKIESAFIKRYVNEDGKIEGDFQGLYILASHFKIGGESLNNKFIKRLEEKIVENNFKLDTGFLSTPLILDVLFNNNKKDIVYKLLLSEEAPSWIYMIKAGATSIWETWNSILEDGSRTIISYNHYSLGSIQDFIVRKIAGFEKDYSKFGSYILKPDLESPFNSFEIEHETIQGTLYFSWEKIGEQIKFVINIPKETKCSFIYKDKNEILDQGNHIFWCEIN